MMKRLFVVSVLTAGMAAAVMITSFAGEWRKDQSGYWYDDGNGSYPVSTWQWIDGDGNGVAERYYFDENGYSVRNATTPDGCTVDCDGAWIQGGSVQIRYMGTNTYDKSIQDALNGFASMIYKTVQDGAEAADESGDIVITSADLDDREKADLLYWYQSAYGRSVDCRFKSSSSQVGTYNRMALDTLDDVLYEILGSGDNQDALQYFTDPEHGYVETGYGGGIFLCHETEEADGQETGTASYLKAARCMADGDKARLDGHVMVYQPETGEYENGRVFHAYFSENPESYVAGFEFEKMIIRGIK